MVFSSKSLFKRVLFSFLISSGIGTVKGSVRGRKNSLELISPFQKAKATQYTIRNHYLEKVSMSSAIIFNVDFNRNKKRYDKNHFPHNDFERRER